MVGSLVGLVVAAWTDYSNLYAWTKQLTAAMRPCGHWPLPRIGERTSTQRLAGRESYHRKLARDWQASQAVLQVVCRIASLTASPTLGWISLVNGTGEISWLDAF
jgi:hypothetical protein